MGDETFQVPIEYEGTRCELCFFRTWVGYTHPVSLRDPVPFEQTHDLPVYYDAVFRGAPDNPQFMRCRKWGLAAKGVRAFAPGGLAPGDHCFRVQRDVGDEVSAGPPLGFPEALEIPEYLLVRVQDNGETGVPRLVRRRPRYSYTYRYANDGTLAEVIVENEQGKRTLK